MKTNTKNILGIAFILIIFLVSNLSCSKDMIGKNQNAENIEIINDQTTPTYLRIVSEDNDGKLMYSNVVKVK